MPASSGLPTHRVERAQEFLAPGAIGEPAAAEASGFAGVDWVAVSLPGDTRTAQVRAIDRFDGPVFPAAAEA